jgi:hypothetical protein
VLKETLTVALDSGNEIEVQAKDLSRGPGSPIERVRSKKKNRSRIRRKG